MLKFLIFLLLVLSESDAKPRQKRLVNGLTADVGEFSFVASLRYKQTKKHLCGAGIISEYFLITAAQCIEDESRYTVQVYAGSVDQYYGGTYHNIHALIVHENYNKTGLQNDIGLIRLTAPMRIGSNMKIINFLPRDLYVYPGNDVTAVGWGYLYYYKPEGSNYTIRTETNRLQYLSRTIISNEECAMKTNFTIVPNIICIDGEDAETVCDGDSGSPLVYTCGGNNFIVGVASWRIRENCTPDTVGVNGYTNVSGYLDWIHAHMKEDNEGTLEEEDYWGDY